MAGKNKKNPYASQSIFLCHFFGLNQQMHKSGLISPQEPIHQKIAALPSENETKVFSSVWFKKLRDLHLKIVSSKILSRGYD